MEYLDFTYRLLNYLDEHNYSQAYLAKQLNFSTTHISNLLSTKRNPSPKFLAALEDFTGISSEYWMTGKHSKKQFQILNSLINSLIESGAINKNGTFDKDIENILLLTLKKEIKNILLEKQKY